MAKRKALSKKVRFEVFKRDSFKCQYCGKTAPEVILHVDHIAPVSKGGGNDIMNLITACSDCNGGKGATELDDKSAIEKQRKQLEELNDRREQLEEMIRWRDGLKSISDREIEIIDDAWSEATEHQFCLNDAGFKEAKKFIRKYGVNAVLDAIERSSEKYLRYDEDNNIVRESVEAAWKKVGGFLYLQAAPEDDRKLYYIRGILRRRCYVNETSCMTRLRESIKSGASPDDMEMLAKECKSWTDFWNSVDELVEEG